MIWNEKIMETGPIIIALNFQTLSPCFFSVSLIDHTFTRVSFPSPHKIIEIEILRDPLQPIELLHREHQILTLNMPQNAFIPFLLAPR